MKTFLKLFFVSFLLMGCVNEKKEKENIALQNEMKEIETVVAKMDSIQSEIEKGAKELDELMNNK